MRLPLDLFSESDFSDENLHLLPERALEIAQLCCGGRRRSENQNFWEAARALLAGSRTHRHGHVLYPARLVINEHDITDESDKAELRFQAAAIELWRGWDAKDAARKHGIVDAETHARLKEKNNEILLFGRQSPRLRRAARLIYEREKPSSIIFDEGIRDEEEQRKIHYRAALFKVQLGISARGAIEGLHELDQARVLFLKAFQLILEGMPASQAIRLCGVDHEGYGAALASAGNYLDRLGSGPLKRKRDEEDDLPAMRSLWRLQVPDTTLDEATGRQSKSRYEQTAPEADAALLGKDRAASEAIIAAGEPPAPIGKQIDAARLSAPVSSGVPVSPRLRDVNSVGRGGRSRSRERAAVR